VEPTESIVGVMLTSRVEGLLSLLFIVVRSEEVAMRRCLYLNVETRSPRTF
jgi:hypothetical protein